ncbi:transcriptional regulator [Pseudovibrio japonicus]|uniref:Transcriptional regulator n=1 Tax=Pseudovibrio japonicus TaxID=366534 RepID=A0ABQ3EF49_9HYPH|nr:helix-turn-helix transcriptional regulator [Pseudovibrio japonicus]GHB36668.1 transcriptional regulator [Pseudovibrio japonicus]
MENHIKTLRGEKKWTQEQFAQKLDVSRQTVIALERGRYDPSLPLAFKIAHVFDLKIEDIFIYDATK